MSTKIPLSISNAFRQFLSNGGFKLEINSGGLRFFKAKERLVCTSDGAMNRAMRKKFKVFLNVWLRDGKEFIEKLL